MFAPGDHHTDAHPDPRLDAAVDPQRRAALGCTPASSTSSRRSSRRSSAPWPGSSGSIGPNGLVADLPFWHFMDWAALGRHGEAAALNAELAGALRAAARLARRSSRRARRGATRRSPRASPPRSMRATGTRAAASTSTWSIPADRPRRIRASRSTPTRAADPVGRRAARALGIDDRAHHRSGARSPSPPRRRSCRDGETLDPEPASCSPTRSTATSSTARSAGPAASTSPCGLMRERYGPMLARGATTLWESFEPTASLCHGFSATPVYQLSTEVLGVSPLEPGFAPLPHRAAAADLDWARGIVPTVRGDVARRLDARRGGAPDRRHRAARYRGGLRRAGGIRGRDVGPRGRHASS